MTSFKRPNYGQSDPKSHFDPKTYFFSVANSAHLMIFVKMSTFCIKINFFVILKGFWEVITLFHKLTTQIFTNIYHIQFFRPPPEKIPFTQKIGIGLWPMPISLYLVLSLGLWPALILSGFISRGRGRVKFTFIIGVHLRPNWFFI